MLKQALVVAALLLPSAFATAHEYTVGNLHIAHPWSLQLPPQRAQRRRVFRRAQQWPGR